MEGVSKTDTMNGKKDNAYLYDRRVLLGIFLFMAVFAILGFAFGLVAFINQHRTQIDILEMKEHLMYPDEETVQVKKLSLDNMKFDGGITFDSITDKKDKTILNVSGPLRLSDVSYHPIPEADTTGHILTSQKGYCTWMDPTGLKGDKGDTGAPREVVNHLDSSAVDAALSANQGRLLGIRMKAIEKEIGIAIIS